MKLSEKDFLSNKSRTEIKRDWVIEREREIERDFFNNIWGGVKWRGDVEHRPLLNT